MQNTRSWIQKEQKRITTVVTSRFKNYYLTGGTALALYYNHRLSEDLDFFTQKYNKEVPKKIMQFLSEKTGCEYRLEQTQDDPKLVSMEVYSIELKEGIWMKKVRPLSEFFVMTGFKHNEAERLIYWSKSFNRTQLKVELVDLVPGVDSKEVIKHIDNEIIMKLPEKLGI